MSQPVKQAIESLWHQVHSATGLPFPQTVAALQDLNVSRYHVDFIGCTSTSYVRGPTSHAKTVHIASLPSHGSGVTDAFDHEALKAATQQVRQGKLTYPEFAGKCMDAGVVGYLTFIEGKRVMYFGEKGDYHLEWFPGAGPDAAK